MAKKDMQNEYDDQTKKEPEGIMQTDTAKSCCSCFCSYIKGTIKATCKVIECIMTPC